MTGGCQGVPLRMAFARQHTPIIVWEENGEPLKPESMRR